MSRNSSSQTDQGLAGREGGSIYLFPAFSSPSFRSHNCLVPRAGSRSISVASPYYSRGPRDLSKILLCSASCLLYPWEEMITYNHIKPTNCAFCKALYRKEAQACSLLSWVSLYGHFDFPSKEWLRNEWNGSLSEGFYCQAWCSEFKSWDPQGRREPNYPLTSMCTLPIDK